MAQYSLVAVPEGASGIACDAGGPVLSLFMTAASGDALSALCITSWQVSAAAATPACSIAESAALGPVADSSGLSARRASAACAECSLAAPNCTDGSATA